MREWKSQSHVRWYCRYHIVIVPKYRKKAIYGRLRKEIGKILRQLCEQFEIELVEGTAVADHVHLCLAIPPKYSVANAVGKLKGKSAIKIHREFLGRKRNFTGFHFWARGYCVSTVGLDEQTIRKYIRNQVEREKQEEQLALI
jgi:putative transposase